MSEPIPLVVTRWKCPHCNRSRSSKTASRQHMARCWHNPAARGCKTCEHYEASTDACGCEPGCNWGGSAEGSPEHCRVGVSLAGRAACASCGGANYVPTGEIFRPRFAKAGTVYDRCPDCGGNGAEVKPGPVVHCDMWEATRG